jgi:hypothetical protein
MTGAAVSPAAYFYVDENTLMQKLDGSGMAWDLYYGGPGSPPQTDARNVYTGTPAEIFNTMLANRFTNAYRTIIIENAGLGQGEIDLNSLKEFAAKGGILVVEGDAQLISSGFSMTSGTAAASGTVRDENFIDAPAGSTITFTSPQWYFSSEAGDSKLRIFAEHGNLPDRAQIGRWNHGAGEIYFITDIDGTVDGTSLANAVNIIGRKAYLESGQMNDAFVTGRSAVIDTDLNSLVRVVMVIGR